MKLEPEHSEFKPAYYTYWCMEIRKYSAVTASQSSIPLPTVDKLLFVISRKLMLLSYSESINIYDLFGRGIVHRVTR